jgi:exosortase K
VKTRLAVLIVMLLAMWGMKRHYADANADALWWILAPTAWLVHSLTGVSFALAPGEGYFSQDRLFLIEKSCAGINFMIAAFGMVTVALFQRVGSATSGVRVLTASLLISYAAAVLVNASRIAVAMWLSARHMGVAMLTSAEIHRIEGIIVYFGGLVLLHELVQWFDRGPAISRRLAVPLAWYYLITLGLPLANGAASAGAAFVRHAAVVMLLPPVFIVTAFAVTDILQFAVHNIGGQLFGCDRYGPVIERYRTPPPGQDRRVVGRRDHQ